MYVCEGTFTNLQFCQGGGWIDLLFAIFNCWGIFNLQIGPPSLLPLSEKS